MACSWPWAPDEEQLIEKLLKDDKALELIRRMVHDQCEVARTRFQATLMNEQRGVVPVASLFDDRSTDHTQLTELIQLEIQAETQELSDKLEEIEDGTRELSDKLSTLEGGILATLQPLINRMGQELRDTAECRAERTEQQCRSATDELRRWSASELQRAILEKADLTLGSSMRSLQQTVDNLQHRTDAMDDETETQLQQITERVRSMVAAAKEEIGHDMDRQITELDEQLRIEQESRQEVQGNLRQVMKDDVDALFSTARHDIQHELDRKIEEMNDRWAMEEELRSETQDHFRQAVKDKVDSAEVYTVVSAAGQEFRLELAHKAKEITEQLAVMEAGLQEVLRENVEMLLRRLSERDSGHLQLDDACDLRAASTKAIAGDVEALTEETSAISSPKDFVDSVVEARSVTASPRVSAGAKSATDMAGVEVGEDHALDQPTHLKDVAETYHAEEAESHGQAEAAESSGHAGKKAKTKKVGKR